MARVLTTLGEMDESDLVKTEGRFENDNELTVSVEYCLLGCDGEAHRTGQPVGTGCFCPHHVHRSVHVALKQGLDLASALEGF